MRRALTARGRLRSRIFLAVLGLAALALASACGDDEDGGDGEPTGQPSSTATTGGSATASPSATATSIARVLARDPHYYIVVAGSGGDSLTTIGDAVDAAKGVQPGPNSAEDLRTINALSGDEVAEGTEVAVRLRLTDTLSFIADVSLSEAIGIGGAGGALVLLQPGLELRDGYLGRLALHRVRLADGSPAEEGYGYVMEYWQADRRILKANNIDGEAVVADPTFIVAGGSLAASVQSTRAGDLYRFTRDGVDYVVKALQAAERTPEQIAALLATKPPR